MKTPNYIDTFSRFVLLFLFFCIIGWLYEVALAFLYGYGFVNRGFLSGPYLPLYGSGAVILIICLKRLMASDIRLGQLRITPVIVFFAIVIITTTLEYAVGWFLETTFDQRFWDYSTYNWQFQGRICLSASVRFGLGGMLFLYILEPLFTRIINRIPVKLRFVLSLLILCILMIDFGMTLYLSSLHGFNPVLAQPR